MTTVFSWLSSAATGSFSCFVECMCLKMTLSFQLIKSHVNKLCAYECCIQLAHSPSVRCSGNRLLLRDCTYVFDNGDNAHMHYWLQFAQNHFLGSGRTEVYHYIVSHLPDLQQVSYKEPLDDKEAYRLPSMMLMATYELGTYKLAGCNLDEEAIYPYILLICVFMKGF